MYHSQICLQNLLSDTSQGEQIAALYREELDV
jgi:hypothetical protein